jgi:DNA-binding transcriptional ArsR family regulator
MPEIKEARQIRALASPRRQAIVDALEANGPCHIAELARMLGSRGDGLYYHVRALIAAGLVMETTATNGRGRPHLVLDLATRPLALRYTRRNRADVSRLVAHMLRDTSRAFDRGFQDGARLAGPARELWAGRRTVWLTQAELVRLNRVLKGLWSTLGHEPKRASKRLYSFTYVLSPLARSTRNTGKHRKQKRKEP